MCVLFEEGNIKNTAHWKPKYKVGDILYVKETFCIDNPPKIDGIDYRNYLDNIVFKADNEDLNFKWKPSVHLKKEDARIFLKITNVRVERLQDMSHEDLLAEGFDFKYFDTKKDDEGFFSWWINLWNSKAKDSYKYEDNPYVFVYEFERVD